jgi:epoxyqueuosine reductase QueG
MMGWELGLRAASAVEKLTADVKENVLKYDAALVGIVSAEAIDASPTIWVGWRIRQYTKKATEIMPDAKSVVVMAYHVWDDMLELAIRRGEEWVYPGYSPLDALTVAVRGLLEQKGYKAAYASLVSHKRLAQLAGFGNYGKNSLIINPVFGPWLRFAAVLTNAEMLTDKPFERDLCGDCEACIKACPADALTPYKVDGGKCLLGIHLSNRESFERNPKGTKIEPSFTKNSHLMCMLCQKSCRYGRNKH